MTYSFLIRARELGFRVAVVGKLYELRRHGKKIVTCVPGSLAPNLIWAMEQANKPSIKEKVMVGEVVLSARQISGLEDRLERASQKCLAEKNHERHEQWYAAWCAEQEQKKDVCRAPQTKVREKIERVIHTHHKPGTIGWRLAYK